MEFTSHKAVMFLLTEWLTKRAIFLCAYPKKMAHADVVESYPAN